MVCGCIPKQLGVKTFKKEWKPPEGKTDERQEVRVQLFVNEVGAINSAAETWEADFWLRAVWKDPHLFEVRGSDEDFRADWDDPEWFQPRLEVVNSENIDLVQEQKFVDGDEVYLEQRYRGALASEMDLHSFPFDHQDLRIDVESTFYALGLIKLVTASEDAPYHSKKCEEHSEFRLIRSYLDTTVNKVEFVTEDDADFERYSLKLSVARRPGFFIGKVGLVNLIIVLIGVSVSFLGPENAGPRITVTCTMLLTVVAFQFTVDSVMPKIGYFTLMDYLLFVCYGVLSGSILQSLVQYQKVSAPGCLYSQDQLFQADLGGFIAQVVVLVGAAVLLSIYGGGRDLLSARLVA